MRGNAFLVGSALGTTLLLGLLLSSIISPGRSNVRGSQSSSSIKIGALLYKISPECWSALLSNASQMLSSRTRISLTNAGVAQIEEYPTNPIIFRLAIWRAGLSSADVVFVVAGDGVSREVIRGGCGDEALACAQLGGSTGYLGFPSRQDFSPVLLHELGHIFGLDHAKDPEDVMYPARKPGVFLTREYVRAMKRLLSDSAGMAAQKDGVIVMD